MNITENYLKKMIIEEIEKALEEENFSTLDPIVQELVNLASQKPGLVNKALERSANIARIPVGQKIIPANLTPEQASIVLRMAKQISG